MIAKLEIHVDIESQVLTLEADGKVLQEYAVSTSANGPGETDGSLCTPRGRHVIAEKFGARAPANAVFIGRRATGEIWTPELATKFPSRDWILTRILWLEGCEAGFNAGGNVDSKSRFIYIHGTPDTEPMGKPASHGCIRMRNADIIRLFDEVACGTPVFVHANRSTQRGDE